MRPVERINPFLKSVDNEKLLKDIWKIKGGPISQEGTLWRIDTYQKEIKEFWLENPDLRYGQLLVNLGILPNIPGFWYHMEEPEILIELDYKSEDVYYWGVNFDKDMNRLPETIWKPISELNSGHLRAIINGGFVSRNKMYRQLMLKVLRKRGERL